MKFSLSSLALGLLATMATAQPTGTPHYTLRTTSTFDELNNRAVNQVNGIIGVYLDKRAALPFYTAPVAGTDFVEFHTYPIGIIDEQIALVSDQPLGDAELLNLKQINTLAENSTTIEKGRFKLASDGSVSYTNSAGKTGGWVAFPSYEVSGTWRITWKTPNAITTQDYIPITLEWVIQKD